MKKIRLFFITKLLFSGLANAQITKGKWITGGSSSFKNYKKTFQEHNIERTQTAMSLTYN